MLLHRREDLRPHRARLRAQQRQEAVRAGAGDQLEVAGVGELLERASTSRVPQRSTKVSLRLLEEAAVHLGQEVDVGPVLGALALLLGQARATGPDGATQRSLQQRVFHHVRQRRRDRQRELERRALGLELVEELDQRDVRLGDRLEEPALFEEAVVLRMPDVGQVGVQDQQQMTLAMSRLADRESRG